MSLTAKITLPQVYLYALSNPTNVVISGSSGSVGGGGSRVDAFTQEGTFRNYANGVTRLILGSAQTQVETIVLRALSPAEVILLRGMVGQTCLFRDTYGRRIFGSFIVTSATDIPLSGQPNVDLQTDVAISFQAVTYAEAV